MDAPLPATDQLQRRMADTEPTLTETAAFFKAVLKEASDWAWGADDPDAEKTLVDFLGRIAKAELAFDDAVSRAIACDSALTACAPMNALGFLIGVHGKMAMLDDVSTKWAIVRANQKAATDSFTRALQAAKETPRESAKALLGALEAYMAAVYQVQIHMGPLSGWEFGTMRAESVPVARVDEELKEDVQRARRSVSELLGDDVELPKVPGWKDRSSEKSRPTKRGRAK